MKTQVGIYQHRTQINEHLMAKGIDHFDLVEVGPFPTRQQAEQWMEYLEKKRGLGKLPCHAVGQMNQHPWYGLTFV